MLLEKCTVSEDLFPVGSDLAQKFKYDFQANSTWAEPLDMNKNEVNAKGTEEVSGPKESPWEGLKRGRMESTGASKDCTQL